MRPLAVVLVAGSAALAFGAVLVTLLPKDAELPSSRVAPHPAIAAIAAMGVQANARSDSPTARVSSPVANPDPRIFLAASKSADSGWVVDRATLSWMPPEFRLEEGDVILGINGEALSSAEQVADAIKGSSEGSAVEFHIRLVGTHETAVYSVTR